MRLVYEAADYVNIWNLSEPKELARTPTSNIYTVIAAGEAAVLKVLTPLGRKEEGASTVALQHFNGEGAVRLLRFDEGAHLLDYVAGEDLKSLVEKGCDHEATAIIGGVINRLHGAAGPVPEGLFSLRRWFRELFRAAEEDGKKGLNSIYTRAAPVADKLLSDPMDERVLHGDIHHENIRHHPTRGWLAIDPKGLYGERTFDAANVLLNPAGMEAFTESETRLLKTAAILAEQMSLPLARLLAFVYVYAALSASWTVEDGGYPRHALAIASLAERHVKL